jgi:hypothetical protein
LREITALLGDDQVDIELDSSVKLSKVPNGEDY